jgi:hypothetical protein
MLEFSDEVNAAVAGRLVDGIKPTNTQLMNLRHEVAKSQLASKDPSLTDELEQKAATHHEVAMKGWDLILEDIAEAEDVSKYVLSLNLHFVVLFLPWAGPAMPFSTLYTLSFKPLVATLGVMFL